MNYANNGNDSEMIGNGVTNRGNIASRRLGLIDWRMVL